MSFSLFSLVSAISFVSVLLYDQTQSKFINVILAIAVFITVAVIWVVFKIEPSANFICECTEGKNSTSEGKIAFQEWIGLNLINLA